MYPQRKGCINSPINFCINTLYSQCYAGGEDYGFVSEIITFAAQSMPGDTQCFSVTIFNDTLRESDETFNLVLTSQEVVVNLNRNELVVTIEESEFC